MTDQSNRYKDKREQGKDGTRQERTREDRKGRDKTGGARSYLHRVHRCRDEAHEPSAGSHIAAQPCEMQR